MRRRLTSAAASLLLAAACAPASAEKPAPDAQPERKTPAPVCHPVASNYDVGYIIALCIFPLGPPQEPKEPEIEVKGAPDATFDHGLRDVLLLDNGSERTQLHGRREANPGDVPRERGRTHVGVGSRIYTREVDSWPERR